MLRSLQLAVAVFVAFLGVTWAQPAMTLSGPFEVSGPVFDIAGATDGSLLFTQGPGIMRMTSDGAAEVATLPLVEGSAVNGLAAALPGRMWAASAGLDLAVGAGVWRVVDGEPRLVGDIETFEANEDPDALAGSRWKHVACEEDPAQGFTAGPQSNPYHLTSLTPLTALVADAAGNTLLSVGVARDVDWVAVFEPPANESGAWRVLKTAEDDPSIECYVQPVPTAVAIGPDGAVYVGELTGAPAVPGWSRVWRIEPGATNVVCPSERCTVAISGLTSVIDVVFGPDGMLYVAELDRAGWLSTITGGAAGGDVKRCDVESGECSVVYESALSVGALAHDASGRLWMVENSSLFGPGPATIRMLPMN